MVILGYGHAFITLFQPSLVRECVLFRLYFFLLVLFFSFCFIIIIQRRDDDNDDYYCCYYLTKFFYATLLLLFFSLSAIFFYFWFERLKESVYAVFCSYFSLIYSLYPAHEHWLCCVCYIICKSIPHREGEISKLFEKKVLTYNFHVAFFHSLATPICFIRSSSFIHWQHFFFLSTRAFMRGVNGVDECLIKSGNDDIA